MYKFCNAVLSHEFSRPKWRPVSSLYQKINRTLEVILGSGIVAGLVYLIYQYVPILDHKRWAAIVILICLVLAAMWLLAAAKRFHEATLAEVYAAQEQTDRDLGLVARRIEHLTLLEGRCDALYYLLENRSYTDHPLAGIPIHEREIKYYEGDIQNTFRERLGSTEGHEYFKRLGPIPKTLSAQTDRLRAHQTKLHELLQADRGHRRELGVKAAKQKQETLTAHRHQPLICS